MAVFSSEELRCGQQIQSGGNPFPWSSEDSEKIRFNVFFLLVMPQIRCVTCFESFAGLVNTIVCNPVSLKRGWELWEDVGNDIFRGMWVINSLEKSWKHPQLPHFLIWSPLLPTYCLNHKTLQYDVQSVLMQHSCLDLLLRDFSKVSFSFSKTIPSLCLPQICWQMLLSHKIVRRKHLQFQMEGRRKRRLILDHPMFSREIEEDSCLNNTVGGWWFIVHF